MTALEFVVVAAAVARLAFMVAKEEGPHLVYDKEYQTTLGIFQAVRWWAEKRMTANASRMNMTVHGVLICPLCVSPYMGVIATGMFLLIPEITFWLSVPFAFSAVAVAFAVYASPD